MKRIGMGDWVFGTYSKWEFIGFVLAKDKFQCRIQLTQTYNLETKRKETIATNTITVQLSRLTLLEDFHVDDIMELIDMSLDTNNKRDFNRLTKYLETIKNNKDVPTKLWKVRRNEV